MPIGGRGRRGGAAFRLEIRFDLLGAGLLLPACAPVDPGFGEALAYDKAIQTVDPDPVYRDGGEQPGSSGDHGQKATERYRKGTVKPVQSTSTGSGSGGGGSSSSSGSGPQ